MAKNESDIFICRLKKDDYRAYPCPFIAHGGGTEIQFRNLTDDCLKIDLKDAPVHRQLLSLAPRAADYVIVNGDARAGLYEYQAVVEPTHGQRAAPGQPKRSARASKARRVLVKGSPGIIIIIDT